MFRSFLPIFFFLFHNQGPLHILKIDALKWADESTANPVDSLDGNTAAESFTKRSICSASELDFSVRIVDGKLTECRCVLMKLEMNMSVLEFSMLLFLLFLLLFCCCCPCCCCI
jgi:hypothetical protein